MIFCKVKEIKGKCLLTFETFKWGIRWIELVDSPLLVLNLPDMLLADLRSHFQSSWLKLTDWHIKKKLHIFIIIQSNMFLRFPKIAIIFIKNTTPGFIIFFKLTNCININTTASHFLTCFFFPQIWTPPLQKWDRRLARSMMGKFKTNDASAYSGRIPPLKFLEIFGIWGHKTWF